VDTYLLMSKSQLVLEDCLAVCETLNFVGEGTECQSQGLGKVGGRRAHTGRATKCRAQMLELLALFASGLEMRSQGSVERSPEEDVRGERKMIVR
jgi:hypothetical protein